MAYDISALKNDLTAVLHGTTLNQITNLDGLINRAGRQLLEDIDPQETKRIVELSGPVFDNVWDYNLPNDVKGNKVIDIIKQVNRTPRSVFLQNYNQAFDVSKQQTSQDLFTIQFNGGIKTIRIANVGGPAGIILNQISSLTDNGTWTAGGGATNLRVDNQNFVAGGGALTIDLSAGPVSGFIETDDMETQDLTDHLNQSTLFLYVYFPSAAVISSVDIRWGSSSSNYYSQSATVTQENTVFQNGWNFLSFPWVSATTVGLPDPSDITYLRVTWNYDGTLQTGVKANQEVSTLGEFKMIEYYSKFLFRDASTGAFQETVTDDTNLINLDTESFNLLFNLVALYAVQQQQGINANAHDGPFFQNTYTQGIQRYKLMYKSEIQKPHQTYYKQPYPVYSRFLGTRRWWS